MNGTCNELHERLHFFLFFFWAPYPFLLPSPYYDFVGAPIVPGPVPFSDCCLRQGAGGTEFARFESRTCFLR